MSKRKEKRQRKPLKPMYKADTNSIETFLTAKVSETDTTITVQNAEVLPKELPNTLTIGGSLSNAETVLLIEKTANTLTVERGHEGIAQAWEPGTPIARTPTAGDHNTFIENIEALDEELTEHQNQLNVITGETLYKLERMINFTEIETITYDDVPLDELQGLIDSLPRQLRNNININILPGEIETNIIILDFSGAGTLNVLGALSVSDITHKVNSIGVVECTNTAILIRGFESTADTGTAFFAHGSNHVQFAHCSTLVSTTGVGFSALHCNFANINTCRVDNRLSGAAFLSQAAHMQVNNPSGENNALVFSAGWSARLVISHEGTITTSANGNLVSNAQGGIVSDRFGRPYFGTSGHSGTGLTAAETVTVPIAKLRNFLRSRSRYLSGNLTINVEAGTTNDIIEITGFFGPGQLLIRGGSAASINRFAISDCSNPLINIQGFTTTSIIEAGVTINRILSHVFLGSMNIAGNAPTVNGINVGNISTNMLNRVTLDTITISNRNIAVNVHACNMSVRNITGSGNAHAYVANQGAIIQIGHAGSIAAAQMFSVVGGGIIIGSTGRQIVHEPIQDNVSPLGVATNRFTQLFATNATINTSDEREKENIVPIDENRAVGILNGVVPISFNRIDDPEKETHWGLSAQQVYEVIQNTYGKKALRAFLSDTPEKDVCLGPLVKSPIKELRDTGEVERIEIPITRYVERTRPEAPATMSFSANMETLTDNSGTETFIEEIQDAEVIEEPIMEEVTIGYRYGLRYSEFIAILISGFQCLHRDMQKIKKELKIRRE